MKGHPDWDRPLRIGGGDLWFAFEEPRRVFAPPLELRVAAEPNGAPAIALELIRIAGGSAGPQVIGMLTIRFVSHYDLAERQRQVFAEHPDAKVEPLIPRGGFLRFEAAEATRIPASLLEWKPLVWSGAGSLTFAAQLDQESTRLLNDALVQGLLLVTAKCEIETWGVASRVDAKVTFNPAELAIEGVITLDALTKKLKDHGAAARAFAERLIGRFAKLVPGGYAFDAMPAGSLTWDLSEPLLVPTALAIESNPLATAREALGKGFKVTSDAPPVEFATGLHVVSLYPNLPSKRVGVLTLSAELRVPPKLPERPQTVTAGAIFREGLGSKTIPIRLSPSEPLAFDYQTVAFVSENGGAKRLRGPVKRHLGKHLTISPDSFPVRFVRVEATSGLLAIAKLQLDAKGTRGTASWFAKATLDETTSALAIAVPLDVTNGTLTITAIGNDRQVILERALDDIWLDLSTFPSAGPRRADVICEFDDAAGLAAIECAPEDRLDEVSLVRLTPAMSAREFRWLVTNPLRDGFRWRWFRSSGITAAPWSDVIDPAQGPLTLKSSGAQS